MAKKRNCWLYRQLNKAKKELSKLEQWKLDAIRKVVNT